MKHRHLQLPALHHHGMRLMDRSVHTPARNTQAQEACTGRTRTRTDIRTLAHAVLAWPGSRAAACRATSSWCVSWAWGTCWRCWRCAAVPHMHGAHAHADASMHACKHARGRLRSNPVACAVWIAHMSSCAARRRQRVAIRAHGCMPPARRSRLRRFGARMRALEPRRTGGVPAHLRAAPPLGGQVPRSAMHACCTAQDNEACKAVLSSALAQPAMGCAYYSSKAAIVPPLTMFPASLTASAAGLNDTIAGKPKPAQVCVYVCGRAARGMRPHHCHLPRSHCTSPLSIDT